MTHRIEGSWDKGIAFDLHTVASVYLGPDEFGHDRWDTTRSEMGELLYQLKYQRDASAIPKMIELLKTIGGIEKFDFIIPVPSSNKNRISQPVDEIAKALGEQRGVNALVGFLDKQASGVELKNVTDPAERATLLENSITIAGDENISGKRILLIDDLYRSGATLNACCSVLKSKGKVAAIGVLTMTKTRSSR